MEPNEALSVIIDNGSLCKAGATDVEGPRAVFPSIIGRWRHPGIMIGMAGKDYYVGDEAVAKRGVLINKYPIEQGRIVDWDGMEKIWHHCYFNELRLFPDEQPLVLTEAPFTSKAEREKMIDMMFDTFNVPSFYVGISAIFSLYTTGRTTGIVFDSGDSVSDVVPIYEGYSLPHTIQRLPLGGRDITYYFSQVMRELGYDFTTPAEREIFQHAKEKLCFVATDYEKAMKEAEQSSIHEYGYELPDGSLITVNSQRFRAPEIYFKPYLVGMNNLGIHEYIYESLMKCDADLRRELCQNICLSGGSTMFPGFSERLTKELINRVPASVKIKITAPSENKYSAWMGASIFSSLSSFQHMRISRSEYQETGASIIHRKCF